MFGSYIQPRPALQHSSTTLHSFLGLADGADGAVWLIHYTSQTGVRERTDRAGEEAASVCVSAPVTGSSGILFFFCNAGSMIFFK